MSGWRGLLGGANKRSRLSAALADYPPYAIPHPGPGWELSIQDAEANLAYLLHNRPQRLATLHQLLDALGVDTGGAYDTGDPKPYTDRLWAWVKTDWPSIHRQDLVGNEAWLRSTRDGTHIALSLVTDVAISLGEVVMARRPDYLWALDLDPENQGYDKGVPSQRRPVVLRPADAVVPTIVFDPEHVVHNVYAKCVSPGAMALNAFTNAVVAQISGAHERMWRQRAAGPAA